MILEDDEEKGFEEEEFGEELEEEEELFGDLQEENEDMEDEDENEDEIVEDIEDDLGESDYLESGQVGDPFNSCPPPTLLEDTLVFLHNQEVSSCSAHPILLLLLKLLSLLLSHLFLCSKSLRKLRKKKPRILLKPWKQIPPQK